MNVLCCIFALFFFVMYMLPVSLDCPFVIASSVFSDVCLTPSFFVIEVSESVQATDHIYSVCTCDRGIDIVFQCFQYMTSFDPIRTLHVCAQLSCIFDILPLS